MIEFSDVQSARARIAPPHCPYSAAPRPALGETLGCQVYLKHESFQAIGTFKICCALYKAPALSEKALRCGPMCAFPRNHAKTMAYTAHKPGARRSSSCPPTPTRLCWPNAPRSVT